MREGNFVCNPAELRSLKKSLRCSAQSTEQKPSVICRSLWERGTVEELSACRGVEKEGRRCPCSSQCPPEPLRTYAQHTHAHTQRCSSDHLEMGKHEPTVTRPTVSASGTQRAPRCAHPCPTEENHQPVTP